MKILSILGTRPEAIKMAPIIAELKKREDLVSYVCTTGQHKEMLDQVAHFFGIKIDFNLNIMKPGQTLSDITSEVLTKIKPILNELKPHLLLVQGDTTTAFAAALAAFYEKIPVGHVEAGLRTGNLLMPFPEEGNRKLITAIAQTHFAPTQGAKDNLLKEGVPEEDIVVTGNSVIDALFHTLSTFEKDPSKRPHEFGFLNSGKKIILVTGHRRENFGKNFEAICKALYTLSKEDVEIVYPVHLNPNVQKPVYEILSNVANIHLIAPLDYVSFVDLMDRSYLILTDSGGVQEEAPSLGKPVLVMREVTERPEAVQAGTVLLVGTDPKKIVEETKRLLHDFNHYQKMARAQSPYGDGKASQRIVEHIVTKDVALA